MFTFGKSLASTITTLGFVVASTIIPATALAAANPNANGKNVNGVTRSNKDDSSETETSTNQPVIAQTHSNNSNSKNVAAAASNNGQEKVRICHRTASYSNPYVSITVARAAVDGIAGNSGNQADHYGEHKGPIFNNNLPKHTEWGDIIPALNGGHDGQNWTDAGRAIYNNDCKLPKAAPVLLASTSISKPAADPTTPVATAPQLANTGLGIWVASLISVMIIAMSALLGLLTRRKLITA